MCKIDQIHSGAACAAPSEVMERPIEQAAVSPSNQMTAEQAGTDMPGIRDAAHRR
jgi:hypothetical protein